MKLNYYEFNYPKSIDEESKQDEFVPKVKTNEIELDLQYTPYTLVYKYDEENKKYMGDFVISSIDYTKSEYNRTEVTLNFISI